MNNPKVKNRLSALKIRYWFMYLLSVFVSGGILYLIYNKINSTEGTFLYGYGIWVIIALLVIVVAPIFITQNRVSSNSIRIVNKGRIVASSSRNTPTEILERMFSAYLKAKRISGDNDINIEYLENSPMLCFSVISGNNEKSIYVTKELVQSLQSDEELVAVILHEMAHLKNGHNLNGIVPLVLARMVSYLGVFGFIFAWIVFGFGTALVYVLLNIVCLVFHNFMAKTAEEVADSEAVGYGFGVPLRNFLMRQDVVRSIRNRFLELFMNHPLTSTRVHYIESLNSLMR